MFFIHNYFLVKTFIPVSSCTAFCYVYVIKSILLKENDPRADR